MSDTPDKDGRTDEEIEIEIADSLSDGLRGTDEAYGIAVAAWGEKDERSELICNAWAEVETAFRRFHKQSGVTLLKTK